MEQPFNASHHDRYAASPDILLSPMAASEATPRATTKQTTSYERRARHKTKQDRYEYRPRPERAKKAAEGQEKRSKKPNARRAVSRNPLDSFVSSKDSLPRLTVFDYWADRGHSTDLLSCPQCQATVSLTKVVPPELQIVRVVRDM